MRRATQVLPAFLGIALSISTSGAGLTVGGVDPSFAASNPSKGAIYAVALAPDGKILLGGLFKAVSGATRNRVARLNGDGTLDTSFGQGLAGANDTVSCVLGLTNGQAVVGGAFTTFNGTGPAYLARLNSDGRTDSSFNPLIGGFVRYVALQPDAKLLIGGTFTYVGTTNRNHIARINSDGTLDSSFDPGAGMDDDVTSIVLQPDGKVLVGGLFTTVNNISRRRIARLNQNGSLDSSFDPGLGADAFVNSLALQPDGKALIVGRFETVNGAPSTNIARLNTDGSLDLSFQPGKGASDPPVPSIGSIIYAVALGSEGKILIGGYFTKYDGTNRSFIARLKPDGSLDTGFDPRSGPSSTVFSLAVQLDGRVVLGGAFVSVDGLARTNVARIFQDEMPQLRSIAHLSSGIIELRGIAATNALLGLEVSSNLSNWAPLDQLMNSNGVFIFQDTQAAILGARFYRARWLP